MDGRCYVVHYQTAALQHEDAAACRPRAQRAYRRFKVVICGTDADSCHHPQTRCRHVDVAVADPVRIGDAARRRNNRHVSSGHDIADRHVVIGQQPDVTGESRSSTNQTRFGHRDAACTGFHVYRAACRCPDIATREGHMFSRQHRDVARAAHNVCVGHDTRVDAKRLHQHVAAAVGADCRIIIRHTAVIQLDSAGGRPQHDVSVAGGRPHVGLRRVAAVRCRRRTVRLHTVYGHLHIANHKIIAFQHEDAAARRPRAQPEDIGLQMVYRFADTRTGHHSQVVGLYIDLAVVGIANRIGIRVDQRIAIQN